MTSKKTYTNKDLRKNFTYCIQFYKDRQGTLCIRETANDGDIVDKISMRMFGIDIARSKLLDHKDKMSLYELCQAFVRETQDICSENMLRELKKTENNNDV